MADNNETLIEAAYLEVLGRPIDEGGKKTHLNAMKYRGIDDIKKILRRSPEYIGAYKAIVDGKIGKDVAYIGGDGNIVWAVASTGDPKSNQIPYIDALQNTKINQVFSRAVRKSPRTTIMVVTSNIMGDLFPRCLQNIKKYTDSEYQIIVVESHFIEDMYNLARDMNIGLRGALNSEYYVSMNDDMFVTEGWLDALIEPTQKDKKIGVVGGLYLFSDKKTIQHGGILFNQKYNPSHRFYKQNIDNTPEAKKECYIVGVTGALVLITKDCLHDVGLWDNELFPLSYNDPDYCLRAWNLGWKVYYAPKCTTIHLQGASVKGDIHKRATEFCYPNFKKKWGDAQISQTVALVDQENKKP